MSTSESRVASARAERIAAEGKLMVLGLPMRIVGETPGELQSANFLT